MIDTQTAHHTHPPQPHLVCVGLTPGDSIYQPNRPNNPCNLKAILPRHSLGTHMLSADDSLCLSLPLSSVCLSTRKKYRAVINKHKERLAKARDNVRRDEQQRVAEEQQQKQEKRAASHTQPRNHPSTSISSKKKKRPRSPQSPSPSVAHSAPPDPHSASSSDDSDDDSPFHGRQHGTVGAIACDYRGHVCAGVSSGGIWMKAAGRIGSAALIGCGCHAENGDDDEKDAQDGKIADAISVACSISGCGEDIIEELMAARCCDALKSAKLSPPKPFNSIIETHAPVTVDNNGNHSDGSSDSSDKQTQLERIMKQLIEKEAMRQATFTASDRNRKKRKKNAQGSNDTQQQDDGLSSGIIACRVLKKNTTKRSSTGNGSSPVSDGGAERMDDGSSAEEGEDACSNGGDARSVELTLDFCYAHTAPHFAVAYAVNDQLNGYQNKGWISQKTEEQSERRIMKLGHVSIAIRPLHKEQLEDKDDEDNSDRYHSNSSSSGRRGRQQQQRDGHVAQPADTTQPNGRETEPERRKKDENSAEDRDRRSAE